MAVLSIHELNLSFGGHPLFDGISFHIEEGDKFCLLGRNGEGKSSLLKVIEGIQAPDNGSIAKPKNLRISFLGQELADYPGQSNREVIGEAHDEARAYFNSVIKNLSIDLDGDFSLGSGGMKRRVLLARELLKAPELLLLDEPTNHLDLGTIEWLEEYIANYIKTLVCITHDRHFARRISNRVAELDRGKIYVFDAGLEQFIQRREAILAQEEVHRGEFKKKLAIEEAWVRRGVKARTKRDEGRVKRLLAMRETIKNQRNKTGNATIEINQSAKSGDLIAKIENVSFSFGDKKIVKDFSTLITRGQRIGIVGANGVGKTSFVKLLLGQLSPETGTIKLGTKLDTIYFDQVRSELDDSKSIRENLAGKDDAVMVGGRQRHINAYLSDFLFAPERANNPVSILSGGEKNRLMLAKLFTKSSNLLILDEPSNDLDMETLDMIMDLLADYEGTLIIISHDRYFLDQTITNLFIMEGEGEIREYVGNYTDYLTVKSKAEKQEIEKKKSEKAEMKKEQGKKLSFNEKRELEELPKRISELEIKIGEIHAIMSGSEFYKQEAAKQREVSESLAQTELELAKKWDRWAELS